MPSASPRPRALGAACASPWRSALVAACIALACGAAAAQPAAPGTADATAPRQAEPVAVDPKLEARVMALAAELRCLVCQNQTIADSHAELAEDLRNQIRTMLSQGKGEREILDYMTQRYGDFVLYRPPFKGSTALLWIGPGLLFVLALGTLIVVLKRRQRMAADAFDPDTDEPDTDDREIVPDVQRR
jgi:cytochrome c-type biogenesis protein CcmH